MRLLAFLPLVLILGCDHIDRFLAIDSCLDSGGAWDYETDVCLCENQNGEEYTPDDGSNWCDYVDRFSDD